ncbi:MAG: hypothetical protein IJT49_06725 [Clostridia bacterium]|nr:hypothetical protein [Clostridia bacterium]
MEITDIADNKTDKDGGIKRRTLINYPYIKCGGKAEKRINAFILKIVDAYKISTAKASLYTYNRLKYKIQSRSPLSLYFESESRGDGRFSYAPFSVTFSSDGYAVPLDTDKATAEKAKKHFSEHGIRLTRKDMKYSYYINENSQTVVYAKQKSNRRGKKDVIEYRIT